jgi:hypothetical protein
MRHQRQKSCKPGGLLLGDAMNIATSIGQGTQLQLDHLPIGEGSSNDGTGLIIRRNAVAWHDHRTVSDVEVDITRLMTLVRGIDARCSRQVDDLERAAPGIARQAKRPSVFLENFAPPTNRRRRILNQDAPWRDDAGQAVDVSVCFDLARIARKPDNSLCPKHRKQLLLNLGTG